jgi:hypothetical protein
LVMTGLVTIFLMLLGWNFYGITTSGYYGYSRWDGGCGGYHHHHWH